MSKPTMKKLTVSILVLFFLLPSALAVDLGSFPNFLIENDKLEAHIVVGDKAPAGDVIASSEISVFLDGHANIDVGTTKLSSEVHDVYDQHLVVVGNQCANSITAKIQGWTEDCGENLNVGEGYIELYKQNDYYQVLVYGYGEEDVRNAANVLTNPDLYKIDDERVVITKVDGELKINYEEIVQYGEWVLKQFEDEVLEVDGFEFDVSVEFLSEDQAMFVINGETTQKLDVLEKDTLSTGTAIKVYTIQNGEVSFTIFPGSKEQKPTTECIDSDGGKDVYEKGETSVYTKFASGGGGGGTYDKCSGYYLTEYYCSGEDIKSYSYKCPHGCSNGKCLQVEEEEQTEQREVYSKGDLYKYPSQFVGNGKFHGTIVVGDKAPADDVIAATEIATSLTGYIDPDYIETHGLGSRGAPTVVSEHYPRVRLASEVERGYDDSLIIIGNPCDNAIAKEYWRKVDSKPITEKSDYCSFSGLRKGESIIYLYAYEDAHAHVLFVAGTTGRATRNAADIMAEFGESKRNGILKGNTIILRSDVAVEETAIVEEVVLPTCDDGVQNGDEEGVDCGGQCTDCAPTAQECAGCLLETTCLQFGIRLVQEDVPVYCDISKSFLEQKQKGVSCQNNYECLSNQCVDGACGSIVEDLKETKSLLQRILAWFGFD